MPSHCAIDKKIIESIKMPRKPHVKKVNTKLIKKMEDFVYIIRPRLGRKYARRIATTIHKASISYKVPPEVILSTGYVESEFNMNSRPCIGIMQYWGPNYRGSDKKFNPYKLEDNIQLGTRELSRYYHHPLASRYKGNWRLRYTWGRYNGAGPHSKYVRRALRVYTRIKTKTVKQLQKTLEKKHSLWIQ